MKDINFKLNQKQHEFILDNSKYLALTSGLGGGKSFILYLTFILNEVVKYPKALHCVAALSNQQLKTVSIPYIRMFLDMFKLPHILNKSDMTIMIKNKYNTTIHLRSEEVSERVRSVEYGSLYIEELSYWDKDNFMTFLGRLRDKNGSMRLRTVFTPNGLNWCYNFWISENIEDRKIIYTSTYANKHLPAEYIKMLEDSYDSNLQKQELQGLFFESNNSQVYYMFDRQKHVIEVTQETLPVTWIGMDQNVNPYCAVCCNITKDVITIVEEIYLENSNTYQMANEILDRYKPGTLTIVSDSTSDSRRTSAIRTDHQILREHGLNVARFRNPRVGDRYNCVNSLLEKGKIKVNSSCKMLIRDLEKFSRDNKDSTLSHISDALGYLCWYHFPIKRNIESSGNKKFL